MDNRRFLALLANADAVKLAMFERRIGQFEPDGAESEMTTPLTMEEQIMLRRLRMRIAAQRAKGKDNGHA